VASSLSRPLSGAADELLLKVTPPRVPRHQLARPRLQSDHETLRDAPLLLVQAPAGFGKTSLLAQWRREYLARGSVVAWLSARAQDDVPRLVQGLALAVRVGAGRPTFGHTLLDTAAPAELEGVTVWLAELAQTALDVVLFVDEADRLPEPARDALGYLLRNAPSNLRVVVAARADCRLGVDDLLAYGTGVALGPAQLAFRLDETLELVRSRFGERVDRDAAARLHELTEGWPLGLQMALSVIAAGADPRGAIATLASRGGALRDQLVALLLDRLDAADAEFLTRIAELDHLHPELCRQVSGDAQAAERLARLARDTPVFAAGEASEWLRLHTIARDALRQRFAALPEAERRALHARAAEGLAALGLNDAAARHALAAGQHELAYDLAERSLYDLLMARGRQSAVLEWLARLPAEELDRRPRLQLAAAWSLALSERHEEADRYLDRILAQPDVDAALRCECALIRSGAALWADDPDRFAALHDPWASDPPLRDPLLLQVHANRSAFRTLLEGEPALARLRLQQAPHSEAAPGYVARWSEFVIGLSYLWEGQVLLAEQLLRPTLARAEGDLGRRDPFTAMLAATLASATWERNQPAEAAALLANRLDALERGVLPEAVLLGFRTLARIAAAEGAEHRALELLAGLDAVGVARRLPRLRIASLADQVRLHARRFRPETCRELCAQIDALIAAHDGEAPGARLWQRGARLLRGLAGAHAAIAAQDWRHAAEILAQADETARGIKQGRLHIELRGLRAWVLDRCGEKSLTMLREAAELATTYGLARVFDDAHPALGDWARQALGSAAAVPAAGPLSAPMRAPVPAAPKARSTPSMALTPKEREVLELAARNLSNKEIGLAMQVGEETIKWHMKNLFAKLDAGTRKQVVQRARLLGLLEAQG